MWNAVYSSFCRLCSAAHKLLDKAVIYGHSGDEEQSYIHYMKYLGLVTIIQTLEDYKKEKDYFNHILGVQNVNTALDNAEKLSISLHQR